MTPAPVSCVGGLVLLKWAGGELFQSQAPAVRTLVRSGQSVLAKQDLEFLALLMEHGNGLLENVFCYPWRRQGLVPEGFYVASGTRF